MEQERIKKNARVHNAQEQVCYYTCEYIEQYLRSTYSYELYFKQSLKATACFC